MAIEVGKNKTNQDTIRKRGMIFTRNTCVYTHSVDRLGVDTDLNPQTILKELKRVETGRWRYQKAEGKGDSGKNSLEAHRRGTRL